MEEIDFRKSQKYIYKNWEGVTSVRNIIPLELSFGVTEYHTEPTNLLRAYDLDKKAERTFDMKNLIPYKEEQSILCSAIHFDDNLSHEHQPKNIKTGFVLCGRRHHNIFAQLKALGFDYKKKLDYKITQGFLTNTDEFVDRQEGGLIAFKSGQTRDYAETLMSEDLW